MSDSEDEVFSGFTRLKLEDNGPNHAVRRVETFCEHEEDTENHDAYFVHIDIRSAGTTQPRHPLQRLAQRINSYMLRRFYFDPRRFYNFFDDVLKEPNRPPPTLREMRQI